MVIGKIETSSEDIRSKLEEPTTLSIPILMYMKDMQSRAIFLISEREAPKNTTSLNVFSFLILLMYLANFLKHEGKRGLSPGRNTFMGD